MNKAALIKMVLYYELISLQNYNNQGNEIMYNLFWPYNKKDDF